MADIAPDKSRRPKGTGSLFFDAGRGLWCARADIVDPVTGERKPKTVRRKEREDAEAALDAMVAQVAAGIVLPTTDPRLGEWLDVWYANITKARPRARASQRGDIVNYIKPAIGTVRLSKLTVEDIEKLHEFVITTKKLSTSTARGAHITLQGALKSAKRRRLITENVALDVDKPLAAVSVISTLSAKQARKVLKGTMDDRLRARWALALLGFRQGEALGVTLDAVHLGKRPRIVIETQLQRLTWSHGCKEFKPKVFACGRKRGVDCADRFIDASPGHARLQLGSSGLFLTPTKSRKGKRVIPLVEPFLGAVRERVEAAKLEPNPYGLLFTQDEKRVQHRPGALRPLDGSPIDPARDNLAWHAILERVGLPSVSLHSARHTTVELLYSLDVPEKLISEIVGHSVISTTRGYAQGDDAAQRKALGKLSRKLA